MELEWKTEQRRIKDLVPLERNPFGKINREKRKRLESKITRLGVFEIPTIDLNNDLLTFNKRAHILMALGRGEEIIDVQVPVRELSPEERKEVILASNVHEGEWDLLILEEDFSDVNLDEIGVGDYFEEGIPFLIEEEPQVKEDDFDIPDQVQTTIVLGDLIEIGPHRLLCGDSTNGFHVATLMNGELADLVVTDPPYNVGYENDRGETILNDKMVDEKFYQFLFEFFSVFLMFTKPGGAWYVWHSDSGGYTFRKAFLDAGLKLRQCLVWVKNTFVMGRQDYQWRHEPCLYGWKDGAAHYFTEDRNKTTVIDDRVNYNKKTREELLHIINELMSDKTKTTVFYHDKPLRNDLHPTMKPVLLIAEQIRNSSKMHEIVADGFSGSGTTMVASHQLKRKCYASELSPEFCQVTIDRMLKLDPSLNVTINGSPYQPQE